MGVDLRLLKFSGTSITTPVGRRPGRGWTYVADCVGRGFQSIALWKKAVAAPAAASPAKAAVAEEVLAAMLRLAMTIPQSRPRIRTTAVRTLSSGGGLDTERSDDRERSGGGRCRWISLVCRSCAGPAQPPSLW